MQSIERRSLPSIHDLTADSRSTQVMTALSKRPEETSVRRLDRLPGGRISQ
ncbi:unnamed protein product [Ectocarpus sp. 13 AM-2016]